MSSNAPNSLQPLPGMGDEALSHTDGVNFYLLMLRKNNRVIRLKVNKLTPYVSVTGLKRIMTAVAVKL